MTKNKSRTYSLFLAGLTWVNFAQAQESTNTSGGEATGSGGTVAYSIGQVVYTANMGSNGSVTQGVQQPYEISTTGIKETALSISLTPFPNPTIDNLTLQINDYDNELLSAQLFDLQGKLISNTQIVEKQTQIDMNRLPPATYFVNVVNQENKNIHSFKIVKN